MKNKKHLYLIAPLAAIIAVIAINYIGGLTYARFDLTSERRYTLSETTRSFLEKSKDTVQFTIYLDGDLPITFARLRREIKDLLDECSIYSEGRLEYNFVDPTTGDKKELQSKIQALTDQGLVPFTIQEKDDDGKTVSRMVFPGAIVMAGKRSIAVNFLKNSYGASPEDVVHNSIQNIEYEITNVLRKLQQKNKQRIAILQGHGELNRMEIADYRHAMQEYYDVDFVNINNNPAALDAYNALIIAKPQNPYTETDKYIIDQFAMRGGNILWMVDAVQASLDSLMTHSYIMGLAQDLKLEDQLFRYGVRVNYNLVLDNQCAMIPLNVASAGQEPRFNPAPWFFFPLVKPTSDHAVSKNVNLVRTQFISEIDTVGANAALRKTIVLRSSAYSKRVAVPVPISFSILENAPNESFFSDYNIPLGVLMEGQFTSLYANRTAPLHDASHPQLNKSAYCRMIVIADGDLARNDLRKIALDTTPLPLGFDKYTRQNYGNREFLLNSANYLCADNGLLQLRARELKIRLLNKNRITEERSFWQVINLVLPLVVLLAFGIIINIIRKRKYTR